MHLSHSASLFSLGLAAGAALVSGVGATPSASLHLYPSSPSAPLAPISAPQLNQLLAYHFDVQGERLGASALDDEIWQWIKPASNDDRAKELQRLVGGDDKKRIVVYVDVDDKEDWSDLAPSSLPATHVLRKAPHVSSFEALVHSYGDRLASAIPSVGSYLGFIAESAQSAIEQALGRMSQGEQWKKTVDEVDVAFGEAGAKFASSIRSFVSWADAFVADRKTDAGASFQALRFEGLEDIRAEYGADSEVFKKAKEMVRQMLAYAHSLAESKSDNVALAVIMGPSSSSHTLERRSDPLSVFSTSLRRSDEGAFAYDYEGAPSSSLVGAESGSIFDALKSSSTPSSTGRPNPANYAGKCFTSASDLEKATNNCSGHGEAAKDKKGERTCYRCKCQQTKDKGSVTTWAGDACEKKDISGPFVLIATIVLGLVAVTVGSLQLLFNEGTKELPSVLAGVSIPNVGPK